MEITLSKDVKQRLAASIQRYAAEYLETEIGELQSALFLQFCLEEIGPAVYNQAISDAQRYMQDRALDLENTCYAPESAYWARHDKLAAQRRTVRKKS